ncbi:MAG TPA: TadE/TadG family type IV pilus assembly protein [Phenylobacterium sp.]|nr:TadE/TadG family type IV pilus assembly protein [Phenylobacterium sp.]
MKRIAAGRIWLRAFHRDRRGVTALTFALSAMVLLAAVFAAIDAARFSAARVQLQDALDSAALAVGASNATDQATITKIGETFLSGQLAGNNSLINTRPSFQLAGKTITATVTADVDPIFMDLFTGSLMNASASAQVVRGLDQTIEMAMVLDTTGSMAGTKIATLKTAATSLVTKVMTGNTNGEVKIGVVPFANYVNMGVASRTQTWASVPADWIETITSGGTTTTPSCYKTSCTGTETYTCTRTTTNDGVTTTTTGTCTRSTGCTTVKLNPCPAPVTSPVTTSYRTHTFKGCYGSPAYPQNVRDSDASRRYPGFLDKTCAKQVTPLTTSVATLKSAITALSASGNTYIPAGLAWGFNMLSPQTPMTEAAAYDTAGPNQKPRKVLLLMTDGANTKLMTAANGDHETNPASGSRALQADTWTAELCTNIKAQKIEIYSVAFDIGSDTVARDLVRNCATDAKHFYDAANSADLIAAFADIAASLQSLHISH